MRDTTAGTATPITRPICALLIGERDDDGAVRVRRRGRLAAIVVVGLVPCRGPGCLGVVRVASPPPAGDAVDAVALARLPVPAVPAGPTAGRAPR